MSAPASLPRVDTIANMLGETTAHASRVEAARHAIAEARAEVLAGRPMPALRAIALRARSWIEDRSRPTLQRVINATGVIVHTNLGRAPLPPEAVAEALGYCNLEYELATGQRGSRRSLVEPLLVELTGAEAAVVVNNCAAALVLALASLPVPNRSRGRPSKLGRYTGSASRPEVIVARGELVEIGGSFRIPEIIESAGVRLREVGTTNRTYAADYEQAIGPTSAAILRVHPSNFEVTGFVARPSAAELAAVAKAAKLPFFVDLGSEALFPLALPAGDDTRGALGAGADAVMFSGDKLLGGPQAGIVVGKRETIDRMARHPLMRALRPDKLALAALEHVLRARLAGAPERVPLLRMLAVDRAGLHARAERLAAQLVASGISAEVIATDDPIGGGSHPGTTLPGAGLALRAPHTSPDAWHAALRRHRPPIIGVIADDRLVIALRTVPEADDQALVRALYSTV